MLALTLLAGLVILTVGAELLVRSASFLAAAASISPLVIGLTVVAFGTSAPEMAVSVNAAIAGQADVAVGNVVGSNILNVLLILGVSSLITPLIVAARLVRIDVPLMIALSLLLWFLALDGRIGRLDGVLLFAGLIGHTVWMIVQSRREQKAIQREYAEQIDSVAGEAAAKCSPSASQVLLQTVVLVLSLVLLVAGSRLFSNAAVDIARNLGVSELTIGLTLVAAGTSLPEVATSVVAAIRGERDIAVGNVVGSNVFNIMGVLGMSGALAPDGLPVSLAALQVDIPVMIATALACLPIFFTGHLIARWEGGVFLAYYVAYTLYLILSATDAEVLRTYQWVMFGLVIPLTVLTLVIGVYRTIRGNGRGRG
jgi:cation:H+ antiporter